MDKEISIKLIKVRIEDEFRKHRDLDWAEIAARKIHTQWSEYADAETKSLSDYILKANTRIEASLARINKLEEEMKWIPVSEKPKEYGRYLVFRKSGKIHFETWNGSGWAYNANDITHYMSLPSPPNNTI